ncbi:MAG: type II secretion system protein [Candidatus Omnitrophica bacterium]|nr:type II secretion system protein [Candidatus Omnitrophota bacterium]
MKNINKNNGFSMVEVMIVSLVLAIMLTGIMMTLTTGQGSWMNADVQIQLNENLRLTMDKVSKELRESGSDSVGTMQVTISDGTGVNGSDVIRFSMPITCEAGGSIIDANGDVANWGAPLTWGCTDSSCMDADDDCTSRDYRYVEYLIDANNQLIRRVLNNGAALVQQSVFAQNISNFQASLSVDQNVVTLTVTTFLTTKLNRQMTANNTVNIFLRNRG